eukprot:TRINITY_DN27099_c0_g1_i1.p1 TRINITY_DN27099_c0_g1~~TRINITY_DN27099_c0_g1_i1.p1  ORF type:complete len:138 (-),score=35.57 TRINITY_DN27099_c0_g1_i1:245-658(-)
MRDMGKKDGANFSNWKWWPNTLQAHRLCLYAAEHGKEDNLMNVLFRYLYEEGKNISEMAVVAAAGDECGLADSLGVLKSSRYYAEVEKLDNRAKQGGIHGVPFFDVYHGTSPTPKHHRSSGAQSSSYFLSLFRTILG